HFRIFGISADIFLACSALFGLTMGERSGIWLGFICGLIADILFRDTPFALSAFTFALVGYTCGLFRGAVVHSVPGLSIMVTVVASMGGTLCFALLGVLFGHGEFLNLWLIVIVLVVGVLNGIFAVVLSPLIRWAATTSSDAPQLHLVRG